jgi:SAM-dependent methyltransferase
MKINDRGYWENDTAEGHGHDVGVAKAVLEFLQVEEANDVIDMGCGDGFYTKYLNNNGLYCMGVDGNPHTEELVGGNGYCVDLSKEQWLGQFDWVLSLEVGEHIPVEYEDVFIENMHRHNIEGIILSWAVEGQGGDGHVNCKDNWEIINLLGDKGYVLDLGATEQLRSRCAIYPNTGWWFKNTLMVFRRIK